MSWESVINTDAEKEIFNKTYPSNTIASLSYDYKNLSDKVEITIGEDFYVYSFEKDTLEKNR